MSIWYALVQNNDPVHVIDKARSVRCPHCRKETNLAAISVPRYEQVKRYDLKKVIVGYCCTGCNEPIALRFHCFPEFGHNRVAFSEEFEELEKPMETFEYEYLPEQVASDFKETLICYSNSCHNATAAMCRRTIQSVATDLGATGSSRVESQLIEAKDTAGMDDQDFVGLRQAILDGHDGAHPHLPLVTKTRAAVLVEVVGDVLYQLYVRKAKMQKQLALRKEAIAASKTTPA